MVSTREKIDRRSMLESLEDAEMWPVFEDRRGGRAFIDLTEAGGVVDLVKLEEASADKECAVAYRFRYRDFGECTEGDWSVGTLVEAVEATIVKVEECRRVLYGE